MLDRQKQATRATHNWFEWTVVHKADYTADWEQFWNICSLYLIKAGTKQIKSNSSVQNWYNIFYNHRNGIKGANLYPALNCSLFHRSNWLIKSCTRTTVCLALVCLQQQQSAVSCCIFNECSVFTAPWKCCVHQSHRYTDIWTEYCRNTLTNSNLILRKNHYTQAILPLPKHLLHCVTPE